MKKIYRDQNNDEYWEKRWESAGADKDHFENMDVYPVKYAELAAREAHTILEAGVGGGRLFFHYKKQGKDIKGMDFSKNAINNILQKDPSADVICADITNLPYNDEMFDAIFAFGLYHNLENEQDLHQAFFESSRVLKKSGKIVFSVRINGLENDIIEHIARKNVKKPFTKFHKWQFDIEDVEHLLAQHELKINDVFFVRNVSFLFKFNLFRAKSMKQNVFNESTARSKGFRLNIWGRMLDSFLHKNYPKHFSNLLVIIASKN